MIFARKINKIREFYTNCARKMPKFYIIIARKIFFSDYFLGGGHVHPASLSPTSMWGGVPRYIWAPGLDVILAVSSINAQAVSGPWRHAGIHLMMRGRGLPVVEPQRPPATHAASGPIRSEPDVRPGRPAAEQQTAERSAELDGQGVVQDRVDGAVCVDHETTEQQEPEALVATPGERVVDDVGAVRQPQYGEHAHHYR